MFKKLFLSIAACCGIVGMMCENVDGMYKSIEYKDADLTSLSNSSRKDISSIKITNCTIDCYTLESMLAGIDVPSCVYNWVPICIELLNVKLDDDAKASVIAWLKDVQEGFGCVLDRLYLINCCFTKEEQEYIQNCIHIANNIIIL